MEGEIKYLTTVSDVIEFGMVEQKLKEHGIPVLKRQDGYGACLTMFTGKSVTGIDVYVPADAYDDAVEIMKITGAYIKPEDYQMYEPLEEYEESKDPKVKKDYTGVVIVLIVIALILMVLKKSLGI